MKNREKSEDCLSTKRSLNRRGLLARFSGLALAVLPQGTVTEKLFPWLMENPRREPARDLLSREQPVLLVIEGNNVRRMLRAGIKRLEGCAEVFAGKRVVIKPNATGFQPYPVTTDVELVDELVQILLECGTSRITVCDSPSFAGLTAERVFSRLGYYELRDRYGIDIRCIDPTKGSGFLRVSAPSWRANVFILTNRLIQKSDIVINLAIPKRHHTADFTCALKNNFGCTYDTFRMLAHSGKTEFFDQCLVEFADAVRPELTIVDSRQLLTKSGPGFDPERSEIRQANKLVISTDMVAVDAYCAELMEKSDGTFNKELRLNRQLEYAKILGLGESDYCKVELAEGSE